MINGIYNDSIVFYINKDSKELIKVFSYFAIPLVMILTLYKVAYTQMTVNIVNMCTRCVNLICSTTNLIIQLEIKYTNIGKKISLITE